MIDPAHIHEEAARRLPAEDIGHDYSSYYDLHIRVTPESRKLMEEFRYKDLGLIEIFRSQIDGTLWYDIPFCWDPNIDPTR